MVVELLNGEKMLSQAPVVNLIVLRSVEIDRAVTFYQQIGMVFVRHSHGKGPVHFASEANGFVFEIYPQRNADEETVNVRIGFRVVDVDDVIDSLRRINAMIVVEPADTEWGRRAVVKDWDGHTVELLTPSKR